MVWHRVATIGSIRENEPLALSVEGRQLAIYRVGNAFFALNDVCPHAYALLSQGFVEGDRVECPLHQAVFHIPTGKCLGPPADKDVTTYPIKIEGDDVSVDV